MNVVGLLLGNRRFPFDLAPARCVVVAHKQSHAVGQFQDALDGAVKHAGIAAWKIGTRRSTVRHEERVADECRVADDMGHASRRVTGREHREGLQIADSICVAILEKAIKLAAIALEFRAFVENLPEDVLDDANIFANAQLSAELALDVGRRGEVISMCVRFDEPLDLETILFDVLDDLVGGIVADPPGRVVDVHDAVDNCAGGRPGILHHIADSIGSGIEKAPHFWPHREDDVIFWFKHSRNSDFWTPASRLPSFNTTAC